MFLKFKCLLLNMCHINALYVLPVYYLARTETETEDNILPPSHILYICSGVARTNQTFKMKRFFENS